MVTGLQAYLQLVFLYKQNVTVSFLIPLFSQRCALVRFIDEDAFYGCESIMMWFIIPVLVATITDGDGLTCEK